MFRRRMLETIVHSTLRILSYTGDQKLLRTVSSQLFFLKNGKPENDMRQSQQNTVVTREAISYGVSGTIT